MKKKLIIFSLLIVYNYAFSAGTLNRKGKDFRTIALQESAVPVRSGIPGERPFWNDYSKRFIYAPAFDFKEVGNAPVYRFELTSLDDSTTYSFDSDKPYRALSPIWTGLPVGNYNLIVIGLSKEGQKLGIAGEREFYRAAPFNGIYHESTVKYGSSARVALNTLLHKKYVEYWLVYKEPDPSYTLYRYPSKIYSALIIGAVTHAKLSVNSPDAERSVNLARIIADNMLSISFKKGTPLEYFPPTYYGYDEIFDKNLLVKITPSVIFSKPVNIETVENYYGPYYASWYSGRVYMRKDGKYKDEIDFSLGDIVDDASQTIIPSFVNPSKRQDYKLLTMSGLQSAKFELTDLTKDQYMNITQVNAELINSLPDPQKDVIKIEKDKIYLFKTANGKKGLIHPSSLTKTSGTIEDVNEKWIENTNYHQIILSTKLVLP